MTDRYDDRFKPSETLDSYFEPIPSDASSLDDFQDHGADFIDLTERRAQGEHADYEAGEGADVVDLPPPSAAPVAPAGPDTLREVADVVPIRDDSPPSFEMLLEEAIELVAAARPSPMSATVKVNRDDLLEILEEARDAVPEEVRAARWLLKEKEEFLASARHERDQIIEQGRAQVARMVERQEVLRAAETKARKIVDEARSEARTTKRQVEDYCDEKLASFAELLDRTTRTVQQGREKFAAPIDLTDVDLNEDSLSVDP